MVVVVAKNLQVKTPPTRPSEKNEFSFIRMQNKLVSAEKFAHFPKLAVDNFS